MNKLLLHLRQRATTSNTWKLHAALTVFLEILELQAAEPMQHCYPRNPVISMNLKPALG